jgi:WD40 repeat protein
MISTLPSQLQQSLTGSCFVLGSPGPLKNSASDVFHISVSLDWGQVASGSEDGILRVWDAETNHSFQFQQTSGVSRVAFSPDGKQIAAGYLDHRILIWNLGRGDYQQLLGHSGPIKCLSYSPDGRYIASGAGPGAITRDKHIRVWDTKTCTVSQILPGHSAGVYAVEYSPDGTQIASASVDVCIWDVTTGVSRKFSGHKNTVFAIAWSPDGQHVASGSLDKTIHVWDVNYGSSRVFAGPTDWIWSLAFSPDSKHLVAGSGDRTVRVFNTTTGGVVLGPLFGEGLVLRVAFSHDGKYVFSAWKEGLIRIWKMDG